MGSHGRELTKTGRPDGRGRPRAYGVVTDGLDPRWSYTPSTIAHFGFENGLLDVLTDEPLSDYDKKRRARVNFGRQRELKNFPVSGDLKLRVNGRWFASWYGWRWHGYEDLHSALVAQEARLAPVWAQLNPLGTYSVAQLMVFWRRLPGTRPPRYLAGRCSAAHWARIRGRIVRVMLVRHAMERSMNPVAGYRGDEWVGAGKGRPTAIDALAFIPFVFTAQRDISISQIVEKAVERKVLRKDDVIRIRNLRYTLHKFCFAYGFPEFGDSVQYIAEIPEPAWGVKRWRAAFVKLGEIPIPGL